jgi:hypothetical protein
MIEKRINSSHDHRSSRSTISFFVCAVIAIGSASPTAAQKTKIGYDKGADFSKFRTYSWAQPEMPASRPISYEYVVETIDKELSAKGLQRVNSNGDLIVIPTGGMEYGSNLPSATPILPVYSGPPPSVNATMWTGASPAASTGPMVAEGSLTLEFVDHASNKAVWNGTVSEKFDPTEKEKSLTLAGKAVSKLLKKFPPKGR